MNHLKGSLLNEETAESLYTFHGESFVQTGVRISDDCDFHPVHSFQDFIFSDGTADTELNIRKSGICYDEINQ